jgi:hypothetical protein
MAKDVEAAKRRAMIHGLANWPSKGHGSANFARAMPTSHRREVVSVVESAF